MQFSESFQIHLSSSDADRIRTNKSDCEFNLPTIEIDSQQQIFVSVQSASIPYTFYNINSTNNTLNYAIATTNYSIAATPGNYSIIDLINFFKIYLTNFTVTYNPITSQLTFVNATNDFTFLSTSTCLKLIGFSGQATSSSKVLTSTATINLITYPCICIATNIQTLNIHKYASNNRFVLCSIPVDVAPWGMINYRNLSQFRVNTFTNVISNLEIKLVDHQNNLVDLNGADWMITWQFDIFDFVQ